MNHNSCPPQIKGKIEHFVSRKAMNIDSIGKKQIEKLYNNGFLKQISDLYNLNKNSLLQLRGFEETSVDKLLNAIEESKKNKFEKVLFALGIRFVGETVAKTIVKHFKSIDEVINSPYEKFILVDEIGEKIANSLVDYFRDENNLFLINELKVNGLQFESKNELENLSNILQDKIFVVSGVFVKKSRNEIKDLIELNGGKISSSISSKTSFVVAGQNMGPKKRFSKQIVHKIDFRR